MSSSPAVYDLSLAVCCMLVALLPLALAGLVLMNTGLGRTRSAAHSMLAAMAAIAVAALVYCMLGFSFASVAGGPAHVFTIVGRQWDLLGSSPLGLRRLTSGRPALQALFQVFGVSVN